MDSGDKKKPSWWKRKLRLRHGKKKTEPSPDDASSHQLSTTPSASTLPNPPTDESALQQSATPPLPTTTSISTPPLTSSAADLPTPTHAPEDLTGEDDIAQDLWAKAYKKAREREPELMADYGRHLSSVNDAQTLETSQSVQAVVKKLLETRDKSQWAISMRGKEINVRKQVERLAKFLLWSDDIVKSVVSTQPYAALAWSGASILLPLLASGTTQQEAMLKGFDVVCHIQLYWKICEEHYLGSLQNQPYGGQIADAISSLYSHIVEYQARTICHLSQSQLIRAWQKVSDSNDWAETAATVKTTSGHCEKLIPPLQQVELHDELRRQLAQMHRSQKVLDEIRRVLEDNTDETRRRYEDDKQRDLLRDLASDYERGKNFNPRRVTGTCEWFLEDGRFRTWRESDTSALLWVSAGPGCGKSVLSRCLVDENRLSTSVITSTVCYFFFKDGEEGRMSGSDALSAILHQLFSCDLTGELIQNALDAHKKFGKSLSGNFSELWRILKACTRSLHGGEIICILDALDECDPSRREIINELNGFYSGGQQEGNSKLKFLITSRPYDDLAADFEDIPQTAAYIHFDGADRSDDINREISLVIDDRLERIAAKFNTVARRKISERLKSMENRTYLWLHLTFSIIEASRSLYAKASNIEELLFSLPSEVSDAYQSILNRHKDRKTTEILLQIILAATRPLTLDEANIALSIALTQKTYVCHSDLKEDLWGESFKMVVTNICGLFLSVYDEKISFIHQTAREFLTSDKRDDCTDGWRGRLNTQDSHGSLSLCCLRYLALPEFSAPVEKVDLKEYPFFSYAAANWPVHYKSQPSAKRKDDLRSPCMLCEMQSPLNNSWGLVYRQEHYNYLANDWNKWSDLTLTSYLGLTEIVKHLLIDKRGKINSKDDNGWTPLSWAAWEGHEAIVRLLADRGADIEAKDKYGWTPLLRAAEKGYEVVVQLLADRGADIEVKDKFSWTPLSRAALGGHEAVVQLLADRGADIEAKDKYGWTPLLYAAQEGHEAVVQLLADRGADIEAKNKILYSRTPLLWAAARGHKAVVRFLADCGADIEAKDTHYGQTPLLWAARGDHMAVVQLLADRGANIEAKDTDGRTPLLWAAARGHKAVVQLLADRGADIKAKNTCHGRTPLLWAAARGHKAVVRFLADCGADIEAKDIHYGQTPLSWAAWEGHEAIVRLLADRGADIEAKDTDGQTPLSRAAEKGYEVVVQLLADRGADIEAKDKFSWTPLSRAALGGHEAVVQLLADRGADIEAKDQYGRTPLSWAAEEGHMAVVQLLADRGADIEAKDQYGRTPLSRAAEEGYEAVVQLLADRGADIEAKDKFSWTPLSWAAEEGHEAAVVPDY